ncbi:MAG TPA: PA2779 family protein [Pyrinomonadaceae bacterium]
MNFNLRDSIGVLVSGILMTSFAVPSSLRAQQHVVSPTEIHKELVNATQTRRQNRDKVRELFSSKAAQKALRKAGMDPVQVKAGVSTLSDAELAQLASRADKARDDFAAGRLSDRDLLIVLVGLAALILIIVAVS